MAKTMMLVLALAAMALAVAAQDPPLCVLEGWKIDPGVYEVANLGGPSFGTFFNPYDHKEFFWVHHNLTIDMYDILDEGSFVNGNPTLSYQIPSGTTCSQSASFMIGDDIYSYHGDQPYCTCSWTPEAPCPNRLDFNGELLPFAENTVVGMNTIDPAVTAGAGLAIADESDSNPASWGCTTLTNPQDVAGKYCITDRGGCFFQTKYDNCKAAGAVGTIVVNRDASVITMSVTDVAEGDILIMINNPNGQLIKDALNADEDVTLSAGRSVGPPAPLPEYSSPDPMGVINAFTGKRDLDTAPFILADGMLYDYKRRLLVALSVDGNVPETNLVMNITTVEDGTYPVIGSFVSGADGSDMMLMYQGDATYLVEDVVWDGKAFVYNVTDDMSNPELLSTIEFTNFCPDSGFDGVNVHPDGNYLYLTSGIRETTCGDEDGDGDTGDYVQEIWDVSDPASPFLAGTFQIDEVDFGALTMNGANWVFGPNYIAAIPMTSSGMVWYDFSDPLNPVAISDVYDPAANEDDFTKGVISAVYGDDGYWYVYEKDGEDGVHGLFHQIQLVPCDLKDICY